MLRAVARPVSRTLHKLRPQMLLCQQLCKKWIEHAPVRVGVSGPSREFTPLIAVSRAYVLLLNERSLVQQRNAFPLISELIELAEIPFPCRQVAVGVDRVDG